MLGNPILNDAADKLDSREHDGEKGRHSSAKELLMDNIGKEENLV